MYCYRRKWIFKWIFFLFHLTMIGLGIWVLYDNIFATEMVIPLLPFLPRWVNATLCVPCGVLLILGFGRNTPSVFSALFKWSPDLVIDDEGITESASTYGRKDYTLSWSEITKVEVEKTYHRGMMGKNQRMLRAYFKNPEDTSNPYNKATFVGTNWGTSLEARVWDGTYVPIPVGSFGMDGKKICRALEEHTKVVYKGKWKNGEK